MGQIFDDLETIINSLNALMSVVRSEEFIQLIKHVADLTTRTGEWGIGSKSVVPNPRLASLHCSTFRKIGINFVFSDGGSGAPISRSAYYFKISSYAPALEYVLKYKT